MHLDLTGRLWAGVENGGLIWYDNSHDRFLSIRQLAVGGVGALPQLRQLASMSVLSIVSDQHNQLWVATQQAGVFVLRFTADGQLRTIQHLRLRRGRDEATFANKLVADPYGHIWVGTLGYGLWRVSPQTTGRGDDALRIEPVTTLPEYNIRSMHLDRRGDLWIGTDTQVFWLANQQLTAALPTSFVALKRRFAHVESLFLDSAKRLWIGTSFGLLLMEQAPAAAATPPVNEQQVRTFLPLDTDPSSISSVRIHDILEGRFHNLWLASSAGGLNQLNLQAKPFMLLRRHMTGQTSPANNYINAVCREANSNRLWIGTRNGFASYDLIGKTYRNYGNRALSGDVNGVDVSAIMQASDGKLWIGTRYSGLLMMDGGQPASVHHVSGSGQLNWSGLSIESMAEDRSGTIWVATLNGMHALDRQGNYLRKIDRLGRLPMPPVTAMLYDSTQHVLWASSRNAGLLKLAIVSGTLRLLAQYRKEPGNPNSLLTNYTWPLVKDKQGTLWIGTIGGGLHRLVRQANGAERIERYDKWIPETDIESLLCDQDGNLWIGGTGLYKFNPKSRQVQHYDVSDGLQSNSFKVGAATQGSDGTFFFGGTNGITYFQPRDIRPDPYPPLVQLTGLRIYNQPVQVGDTINGRILLTASLAIPQTVELNASENDFSVEFVGLNYVNPHKQQYAYQLEGYNDGWVQVSADRRVATFANLLPGTYTFRVKASNSDGVWSVRPASLRLTILPPWWKTWWAYLLYVVVIGGGLALYRRSELASKALENRVALEQYKAEKEKEVTDLKVQFFTSISHELRTPLTLILGPVEELANATGSVVPVKDKIRLVHQQTHKLLNLVNQIMDFRKIDAGYVLLRASRDNIIPFLTEIVLIFKLKAEELRFDYTLQVPSEPIVMYFDRSKLEIILTNLLSNAFKYTPERGRIRVDVTVVGTPTEDAVVESGCLLDNYLQLSVRDWGVGMQAQVIDRIFDPYYRAFHADTRQVAGTGIGLALVKQYTLAHAGDVTVDSAPGLGTTFTVRLPFGRKQLTDESILEERLPALVATPEQTGAANLVPPAESPLLTIGPARVLVVEDNHELRQYIYQLLSPPLDVLLAEDGLDGWSKALEYAPDLVVTDVMMPRSNGLELCRTIKQHPKTMHIPVMLLTARTAAVHELEGLETGADEYMAKPFDPRLLVAKISAILQTRQQLRTYYQRQLLLQPTEVTIPGKEKKLLETAISIIEANLTNPDFSIPVLVRELGTSQSVLYKQIKAITGQSLIEFVRDIRLKRAAQLLIGSDMKIVDIARQVGFEDIKYFRKAFQTLYTMTPSEYARQHRNDPADPA
jgi:signal transduction histidine kinase/ligand-binding sensor domain-containing protein/DNA-binding response OmpR family regulator